MYQRYLKRAAVTFLNKGSPIDKVYISREGVYIQNLILTNPVTLFLIQWCLMPSWVNGVMKRNEAFLNLNKILL